MIKQGNLVGTDQFGNKYYENTSLQAGVFAISARAGCHRTHRAQSSCAGQGGIGGSSLPTGITTMLRASRGSGTVSAPGVSTGCFSSFVLRPATDALARPPAPRSGWIHMIHDGPPTTVRSLVFVLFASLFTLRPGQSLTPTSSSLDCRPSSTTQSTKSRPPRTSPLAGLRFPLPSPRAATSRRCAVKRSCSPAVWRSPRERARRGLTATPVDTAGPCQEPDGQKELAALRAVDPAQVSRHTERGRRRFCELDERAERRDWSRERERDRRSGGGDCWGGDVFTSGKVERSHASSARPGATAVPL